MSITDDVNTVAVLVTPNTPDPTPSVSVAAAFSYLRGLAWQQVRRLTVIIHLQGGEVMRQLAHLGMSGLGRLALFQYNLDVAGSEQLTSGIGVAEDEQLHVADQCSLDGSLTSRRGVYTIVIIVSEQQPLLECSCRCCHSYSV